MNISFKDNIIYLITIKNERNLITLTPLLMSFPLFAKRIKNTSYKGCERKTVIKKFQI